MRVDDASLAGIFIWGVNALISRVPYEKPATTHDQQVERLAARGLRIENKVEAQAALERLNYYRLSAYWYPFKQIDGSFRADGSFEKALEFYEYDRRLRLVLLDMLERIEVRIRGIISYHMAHVHGPWSHEEPNNFDPGWRTNHAEWIVELRRETERSRETFIEHFRRKYAEYPTLPIWVAAEIMSFGTLARFYRGLKSTDQAAIAAPHGIHHQVFASWMLSLNYVRNMCAHHSRLWNRELSIAPKLPRADIWQSPRIPNNKKIYVVLCILRHLSWREPSGDAWAAQVVDLMKQHDAEPRWLNAMGIPRDWKENPFWNQFIQTVTTK